MKQGCATTMEMMLRKYGSSGERGKKIGEPVGKKENVRNVGRKNLTD